MSAPTERRQLSFELGGAPAARNDAGESEPVAAKPAPEAAKPEPAKAAPEPPQPIVTRATPSPAPTPPAPVEPRILSVTDLVRGARLMLEARFADVRVDGEISGCKKSPQGHLYFTLKDGEAQVDCVTFAREAARLKFKLQDGLRVRCRGRLTIYEGRGKFQFCVSEIEPTGAGALALAFEQLKQRLAAEGLFDPARKRKLPFLPRRIGVVTSATGAVLRDIIRVAHRRFPVRILLAPTPVQGDGAAHQIVAALERVARAPEVDLVIVARGGGSLEDLWAFNDEGLARAIARCPVPVISAVGHETDFTIADFVADVRAPTPSAAAELAVPVVGQLREEVAVLRRRCGRALSAELRTTHLALERLRGRLGDPRRLVGQRRQAIDELAQRAAERLRAAMAQRRAGLRAAESALYRSHPQRRIADQRAALTALERRLQAAIGQRIAPRRQLVAALERRLGAAMPVALANRRRALHGLHGKLEALAPTRVLERGYALARTPEGHVVTHAAALRPGDAVVITLRDGDVDARVEATRPAPPTDDGERG
jgi:exodeoxyribonuclease VII large subunit